MSGTEGALLTEALIVVPVVTIFAVGILEFGNVFWQRHQVQVGVRDAARYWSRCRGTAPFNTCTQDIARNLAFYGNPAGTGAPRVPGWINDDDLDIAPLAPHASASPSGSVPSATSCSHSSIKGQPVAQVPKSAMFR